MSSVREALAALAHEQWSGWIRYLFSKGTFMGDGSWVMPSWAVERWQRQLSTPYDELSEAEKENDRAEADRVLALLDLDGSKIEVGPLMTVGELSELILRARGQKGDDHG